MSRSMARCYFHLRDGGNCQEDLYGVEFSSVEDAHDAALDAVRLMVSDLVLHDEAIGGLSFDIEDGRGSVLETVHFHDAVRFED
jgi:hypothetical protein